MPQFSASGSYNTPTGYGGVGGARTAPTNPNRPAATVAFSKASPSRGQRGVSPSVVRQKSPPPIARSKSPPRAGVMQKVVSPQGGKRALIPSPAPPVRGKTRAASPPRRPAPMLPLTSVRSSGNVSASSSVGYSSGGAATSLRRPVPPSVKRQQQQRRVPSPPAPAKRSCTPRRVPQQLQLQPEKLPQKQQRKPKQPSQPTKVVWEYEAEPSVWVAFDNTFEIEFYHMGVQGGRLEAYDTFPVRVEGRCFYLRFDKGVMYPKYDPHTLIKVRRRTDHLVPPSPSGSDISMSVSSTVATDFDFLKSYKLGDP